LEPVGDCRVTYIPRRDAMPDGEISALAAVYRFILFESRARKERGPAITTPDDDAKGFERRRFAK